MRYGGGVKPEDVGREVWGQIGAVRNSTEKSPTTSLTFHLGTLNFTLCFMRRSTKKNLEKGCNKLFCLVRGSVTIWGSGRLQNLFTQWWSFYEVEEGGRIIKRYPRRCSRIPDYGPSWCTAAISHLHEHWTCNLSRYGHYFSNWTMTRTVTVRKPWEMVGQGTWMPLFVLLISISVTVAVHWYSTDMC